MVAIIWSSVEQSEEVELQVGILNILNYCPKSGVSEMECQQSLKFLLNSMMQISENNVTFTCAVGFVMGPPCMENESWYNSKMKCHSSTFKSGQVI